MLVVGNCGDYMGKNGSRFGEFSIILAAAMWGCIGIFTRKMSSLGFSSVQTVAIRALITTLMVFLIIIIKDKNLLKIKLKDIWIFLGTGLCSFLFFNICYMTSIKENSISISCILLYTSPIWVILLSLIIFKEKMTTRRCISLPLCLLGCIAVCCSSSLTLTSKGLLFGLLSGFGYALYSIFGKVAVHKYSSLTITFYTFLLASLGVLPFCKISSMGKLLLDSTSIFWSIGIALINTIFPYLLYTYGLSKTTPGKAAVLSIMEPVVAALVGTLLFAESLGIIGILGIAIVILGLIILQGGKNN